MSASPNRPPSLHVGRRSRRDDKAVPTPRTVEEAQAGDRDALATLYRWLGPDVVRYLASQDPYAAEDIASETWISVARNIARFDGGVDDVRRWVFSIAKRRLTDHRRREGRRPRLEPEDAARAAVSSSDTAAEAVAGTNAFVDSVLGSLPKRQAEVVALRVLGGLDIAEVAAVVGRRPGTVRVQLHRALRQLAREAAIHNSDSRP